MFNVIIIFYPYVIPSILQQEEILYFLMLYIIYSKLTLKQADI